MTCSECGAVVSINETWRHQNFHQQLDDLSRPVIPEEILRKIASYDEALMVMRYWLDGVYIMLDEDPVFDPPRKIPTDEDLDRWKAPPPSFDPLFEDDDEPF